MNLVTLTGIIHQYSERLLLDNVSLLINQGDRIGLIGINGSGKTTLLRLIAGMESPNQGGVTVWGGVRVRFLSQHPDLNPEWTVLEQIFDTDTPALQLLKKYELTSYQLQQRPDDSDVQARFLHLSAEMDRMQGWAAEAQAKAILTRLGITQFEAKVGELSGGQQKRVALAQALLDPGDLLLLDEPTNHIDAETIDWLEGFLREMPASLLMVTHDRYFLDRVVNRIVELDRRQLINYPGNYSRYLELSEMRHEQLKTKEERHRNLLRRELEWLRRGAMARSTKQKARIQRVEVLQTIQHDSGEERVSLALAGRRLGKKVLTAEGLGKGYDGLTLFGDVDFTLEPGDRIGIVGPNGAGKSTLLDILAGLTPPDSGTVTWGETAHLGYYDQQSRNLPVDRKVIDFINDIAPLIRTNDGYRVEAAQMLEWFLFPRPQQQAYIGSLSGGERRRVYLLSVLARQPNVLFLDEPTNDLDLQTLQVLEQFLDNFQGALVVVSHDRYFLDRNVDFLAAFENGTMGTRYPAPYEAFARHQAAADSQPSSVGSGQSAVDSGGPATSDEPPAANGQRPATRKLSYNQQRELAALEERLPQLEDKQAALQAAMAESASDYVRLQTLAAELAVLEAELDETMTRWLELMEG